VIRLQQMAVMRRYTFFNMLMLNIEFTALPWRWLYLNRINFAD